MDVELIYQEKLDRLLAVRHSNGADYWSTPDKKLGIDKPISTLTAMLIMSELRIPTSHEALQGASGLIRGAVREDGRVRIAPKGSMFPCHTALAAAVLCRNGFSKTVEAQRLIDQLVSNRHTDGGWRCKKFIYGRGPETEHSNPGVTLLALDALRCSGNHKNTDEFDDAVETLLKHWTVKAPTGPCHFGIGKQFMQIEYPFYRYNLFYYVYVLSFYRKSVNDKRFLEAFGVLTQKLDSMGRIIIEKTKPQLQQLGIYKIGESCEAATERFNEINTNLDI